jgi:membrane protein
VSIRGIVQFLRGDLWRIRLRDQSRRRSFLIRQLRVIMLSLRGYDEDKCSLRASALTFFTLMSIVPVLAMAFGVARGFDFQDALQEKLLDLVRTEQPAPMTATGASAEAVAMMVSPEATAGAVSPEMTLAMALPEATAVTATSEASAEAIALGTTGGPPVGDQMQALEQVLVQVIDFSNRMLDNTSGSLIGLIGLALLFWTIIKLLGNIEHSFNDIWGIKRPRTLWRKFSDYLSFMLISPVLFLLAGSVTVVIATKIEQIVTTLSFLGPVGGLILFSLKLTPFVLIWALLTFLYMFMPNDRVHFRSALLGAIVAGTLFQAMQWVYITFQVGIGRFGAIYGSFAALPLFLVWLQLSWLIVLYGAELAFAHQNVDTYEFEPDCLSVSPAHKRLITLGVVHHCIERFRGVEDPPTATDLSHLLETPSRLIHQILFELVDARVLSEILSEERGETTYQPAQDIAGLTTQGVIDLLDNRGIHSVPYHHSASMERIAKGLRDLRSASTKSEGNFPLRDL